MGKGGRRVSAGECLPEEPWRIPIARAERDQDENDAGIVAVKTQALGIWRLGRDHDDVRLFHFMRSANAP